MLQNNLLIFPTSRSIREYITSLKSTDTLVDKAITIGDFFQNIVLNKSKKPVCDKNLKILFLKEAIKNIDIKKLGLDNKFSSFLKQSDYIFRFFSELNSEYVILDELLQFDTYSLYEEHIILLKAIYENYRKILDNSLYSDSIFLPLDYKLNFSYLDQFNSIILFQEGYFTKFEYEIITQVAQYKQTFINIVFNQYNKKNFTLFPQLDLEIAYKYKIDFTNNCIVSKESVKTKKQNIIITPLSLAIEQIGFIKYQITSMINSGIVADKIAVLLPDEEFASILKIFDNENYFNFAMGNSLKNNKVVKIVEFIIKILNDEEPIDKIKYKWLNIDDNLFGLIKINWHTNISFELFNTIVDSLFNYEIDDDVLEELEKLKIYLENLFFNKDIELTSKIKLKEFFKVLYNELIKITIDDTKGGKITVLGILETRLVEFDGIIIVDFNDAKIPKISIKDKFLSSKLKEKVALPSLDDRYNLQKYYYKRFLDKAKYIAISYIDDEVNILSRFITQLYPNYKQYIKKADYSTVLYNAKQYNHFQENIILDIDLSTLQWSATNLKSYLTCKREYYFRYILKIKDHNISLKPESFEIGNIIHNILEKASKQNCLTSEFINSEFNRYSKSNPYLILELEIWKKRLQQFIQIEQDRKAQGIKIIKTEYPFVYDYKGIKLVGKIDRIDQYPDKLYEIIDYKTSSSLKIDTIKTYKNSKDFQLEFYYLALKDKNIKDVLYYDLYNCKLISEITLKEKLALLENYLDSLKTTKVNFNMTEDLTSCRYCSYKVLCNRENY